MCFVGDNSKYCYGIVDTLHALEMGAVDVTIVWENLETMRYLLKNSATGGTIPISTYYCLCLTFTNLTHISAVENYVNLHPDQTKDERHFRDRKTGAKLEIVESTLLVEWLANNYKRFGTTLRFVTDRSSEGTQFCRGFGGLGGILRYQLKFE